MKLFIVALVIELLGIACLLVALFELTFTNSFNPAIYIAPLGGFLLTCGGFLVTKIMRRKDLIHRD